MIIDLRTLPEETRISEILDANWWSSDGPEDSILGLDRPLKVTVHVSKVGDKYLLDGEISGGARVRCDRCLEAYHWELESSFHVYLQVRPTGPDEAELELLEEDMEVECINGETVDLDAIIREQVYLTLPMKNICREDCPGLCPICGANLNEGPCRCKKDSGHPAFSKLKFLKTKGESG
jgi:uncharacterized protein